MIRRLWQRFIAWLTAMPTTPPKTQLPTPFMHEMKAYRAEGVQQTRASLRAQRRDRQRRELLPIETGLFDDGEEGAQ